MSNQKRTSREPLNPVSQIEVSAASAAQAQGERMLALTQDLICVIGTDGLFKYANPAWKKLLGYPTPELISKPFIDFIHSDDHQGMDALRKIALAKRTIAFENQYTRQKDGSIRTISWTATPLPGENLIYCIGRDITRQTQIEKSLRESEERYRSIVNNIPDVIWISRKKAGVTFMSPQIEKMLGYPLSEWYRQGPDLWHKLVHPDDQEKLHGSLKAMVEHGTQFDIEIRFRRNDGKWIWLHDRSIKIQQEDEDVYYYGLVSDITESKRTERAVKESEQRFRQLVENSKSCVAIYEATDDGKDFIFREFNRKAEQTEKIKRQKVIGKKITEVFPGIKEFGLLDVFQRVYSTGRSESYPTTIYEDERISGWRENYVYKLPDDHIVAIYEDVTDRKRAEENYKLLFESIPDDAFVLDRDWRYVVTNQSSWDRTSFSRDNLIGNRIMDVYPNITETPLWQSYVDAMEKRIPVRTEAEFTFDTGKYGWYEMRMLPMPEGILVISRDITERKQAEEKMLRANQRLRLHSERSPLGFLEWDENFCAVEWNAACERIFGYTREEAIGRHAKDLILHPDVHELVDEIYHSLMNQTGGQHSINDNITKDGRIITCEWFNTTLIDKDGKPIGVASVCSDITERKQAEEKERELSTMKEVERLRSELLANVSHELRTPLQTIKGYATMMSEYDERLQPAEKKSYLKSIDTATERLAELIDQLLDMSRLETGMFTLRKEPTDLAGLLREAIKEAKLRTPKHTILYKKIGKLPEISIDAKRIRQVLDNLLDNAAKYSPEGSSITASLKQQEEYIRVSISDEGRGIPPEDLTKVFDRMYRIHERLTPQIKGVGLGLAIARKLIEAHGGKIWAENEPEKGATFHFTLPHQIDRVAPDGNSPDGQTESRNNRSAS